MVKYKSSLHLILTGLHLQPLKSVTHSVQKYLCKDIYSVKRCPKIAKTVKECLSGKVHAIIFSLVYWESVGFEFSARLILKQVIYLKTEKLCHGIANLRLQREIESNSNVVTMRWH